MADRLTDQQRERLEQSRRQAAQRRAGDGHADEIRNGFAFPPTSVAGQIQGGTSELRHRGFKANASPETRFFEYQGASVVLEQVWTMAFGQAGFESERPIEDRMKIVDIEIDEVSQVLHRYELDF